jgi:2,3-bisphosphoglycerate-independent phosphoglycerate mutase
MDKHRPKVLIVLDGWGHRDGGKHNAIAEANTPFYDSLIKNYPHTLLNASEEYVGLPIGTIGNSEIGHMTMGAGKVIDTDLVRISKNMMAGGFNANPAFLGLFEHVKKYNSTLHIMGLLSAGGVHSHQEHLHGFLNAAKQAGLTKVVIHAFTDGRDVAPQSAAGYLKELEKVIEDIGIGYIATATGRYFAMDRDKNWQRTEKAEKAIFEALGQSHKNKQPSEVMAELYKEGIIDELLEPMVFLDDQGKAYPVADNDGIFFFNFRSDRPRQLAQKIAERAKKQNLYFTTLTQYHPAIESQVAFPPSKIETTLAAEISQAGLTQAHIAETEKYAHVTFFFNGGRQEPYQNERQILVESRKDIATHDQAPEMRAHEIADKALEEIAAGTNFILINFANADMVGHTADKPAIIKAVETVDRELKRVVETVIAKDGVAMITADHGNAEVNFDEQTGHKHTAHTLNLVPFILVSNHKSYILNPKSTPSTLADIAPTILELMSIKKPAVMTGLSLLK